MSFVVLIHGEPGNGKSYLAEKLQTEHSFAVLGIDETYVDFIRYYCPRLYFELLDYYIGPHYYHILKEPREYSKNHLGRDFVGEWHTHLQSRVQELSALHDRRKRLDSCGRDHIHSDGRPHGRLHQRFTNYRRRCENVSLSDQLPGLRVSRAVYLRGDQGGGNKHQQGVTQRVQDSVVCSGSIQGESYLLC